MNIKKHYRSQNAIEAEINRLERLLKKRGGLIGPRGNLPPEMRLQFLRQVYAVEMGEGLPDGPGIDLDKELRHRLKLPEDPDLLSDDEIGSLLVEMIELLASFHLLLNYTDHLTDRELYKKILEDVVTEPLMIEQEPGGTFVHQDCCPFEDDKQWPEDYPRVAERDRWISSLQRKYLNKPLPAVAATAE